MSLHRSGSRPNPRDLLRAYFALLEYANRTNDPLLHVSIYGESSPFWLEQKRHPQEFAFRAAWHRLYRHDVILWVVAALEHVDASCEADLKGFDSFPLLDEALDKLAEYSSRLGGQPIRKSGPRSLDLIYPERQKNRKNRKARRPKQMKKRTPRPID